MSCGQNCFGEAELCFDRVQQLKVSLYQADSNVTVIKTSSKAKTKVR
jgi:hypothetical protein